MTAINWTQKAVKQLRKLDRQQQIAIRDGDGTIKVVEIEEVRKRDERTY
ncbi:mRNA interferase RelE/StbE [Paraburkholderia sp. GAS38]|jgi:mRNA-degrading endonuclease RelE of RelBE toxin-antitoxin system